MSRENDHGDDHLNDAVSAEGTATPSRQRRRLVHDSRKPPSLSIPQAPRGSDAAPEVSRPSPVLPDDLIVEILLRLPVKCVLQSRCVCKGWKTLISDLRFVCEHFQRTISKVNRDLDATDSKLTDAVNTLEVNLGVLENGGVQFDGLVLAVHIFKGKLEFIKADVREIKHGIKCLQSLLQRGLNTASPSQPNTQN